MAMPLSSASDSELLDRYSHAGPDADAAFSELVRRHLDGVYSSALRRLGGDAAGAADLAQRVFVELARQAGALKRHPALIAWLFTTTRQMASRTLRDELRRRQRERDAVFPESMAPESPAPDWQAIAPLLDSALDSLDEEDRQILLLRHLERQPFGAIGARLGLKGNTARMRADRALEKLRRSLSQRGVTSAAAALVYMLEGPAVTAAPTGLVTSISTAAISAASTPVGFLTLMASTTLKTTFVTLSLAALGTAWLLETRETHRLRDANAALVRQIAIDQEELDSLRTRATPVPQAASPNATNQSEILRLRGQIAHLLRERQVALSTNRPAGTRSRPDAVWNPLDGLADRGMATPQDASVSFLAALRAQNPQRFNELVQLPEDLDAPTRDRQLAALYQLFSQRYAAWEFTGLSGENIGSVKRGDAVVEAGKVDLEYVDTASTRTGTIRVDLRRTEAGWRVAVEDFPRDRPPASTGP
jgi:RNA polymerase sigma factor (sigma-70 family)